MKNATDILDIFSNQEEMSLKDAEREIKNDLRDLWPGRAGLSLEEIEDIAKRRIRLTKELWDQGEFTESEADLLIRILASTLINVRLEKSLRDIVRRSRTGSLFSAFLSEER